jgi:hypothetical protein
MQASFKGCLILGMLVLGGPWIGMLIAGWLTPSDAVSVVGFLALPLSLAAGYLAWQVAALGWLALRVAGKMATRQPVESVFEEPAQQSEVAPMRWVLPIVITCCGIISGLLVWLFAREIGLLTSLAVWLVLHGVYGIAAYFGAPHFAADIDRIP